MEQEKFTNDLFKNLLLTSILSLWVYWLWSRRAFYQFALKFPGHFGLPVIGSFIVIKHFRAILQALDTLFQSCKSNTICVWLGLFPTLFSCDPEFIEKVLSSPELLNKAETTYTPVYEAFQGGLISSPEPIWKHHRKALNSVFHHKILISFLSVFHKGKNSLLSTLDTMVGNGDHKLHAMLQRFTLGISFETTMGKELKQGDKVDEEIISKFKYLSEKINLHIMLSYINMGPLFILHWSYQSAKKRCYKIILELLDEKFKRTNNNEDTILHDTKRNNQWSITKAPNIFIDQAIENYNKKIFSYEDIVVESNNIVAASFDTTANGIHSVLLMLATHPDVQERLFEEIVNIFPEKDFEMKYEHFEQLPYLDMVINETLRLAPSVPLVGRQVVKETQLSEELVLPKGLEILISIYHVHRRKDIWGPKANSFNPDNFLPENAAGRHPYAYLPFSKGMRNCLGWRYALFAMKVILAGVVRNYRFATSVDYKDVKYNFQIALRYTNEPSLKVFRRS